MESLGLKFYHYSQSGFEYDSSRKYHFSRKMKKAYGFWLSVEESWFDWCMKENFKLDSLLSKSEFSLDLANILILSDIGGVREFSAKYGEGEHNINWLQVSKKFKGFLVHPYIQDFDVDENFHWYSLLDSSSACVWDLSCIKAQKSNLS